jgi:hypothetical protein
MKMNEYIVSTIWPIYASLISGHCSGALWDHITRPALLAVALGTTVVLATGLFLNGDRN